MRMLRLLKFILVQFGIIYSCTVFAVTLPSSSYKSYDPSDIYVPVEGEGVRLGAGSFSALKEGAIGSIQSECTFKWTRDNDPTGTNCSSCCSDMLDDLCGEDPDNCPQSVIDDADACDRVCDTYPLPLDAPLWFMLALAAVGAAFSVTLRRRLA